MAEVMIMTTTNAKYFASISCAMTKYFAMNPLNGGIPAIESKAAVKANANTPFLLYRPFNGFPSKVCVSLITPKAMIPAMLYVSK